VTETGAVGGSGYAGGKSGRISPTGADSTLHLSLVAARNHRRFLRFLELFQLDVVVDDHRQVTGELLHLIDSRVLHLRSNAVGHHLEIRPPAITFIYLAAGPPAVLIRVTIGPAKRIHIAQLVEQLTQPLPLVRQEAGVMLVLATVGDIAGGVSHGPVTAEDILATL